MKPNVSVKVGPWSASPFRCVKPMTFPDGSVIVTWSPTCTGEPSPAAGLSGTLTVPWTVNLAGALEQPAASMTARTAIKVADRFTVSSPARIPLPLLFQEEDAARGDVVHVQTEAEAVLLLGR